MLDSKLKGQLKDHLQRISRPVELVASIDDGDKSREMLELLHDIQSVCDRISIDVRRNDAERKPSFALRQPGAEPQVRFAGLPMGHEFTSLVLALLQTGGHPPKVGSPYCEAHSVKAFQPAQSRRDRDRDRDFRRYLANS